jgi:hypothetical protein
MVGADTGYQPTAWADVHKLRFVAIDCCMVALDVALFYPIDVLKVSLAALCRLTFWLDALAGIRRWHTH